MSGMDDQRRARYAAIVEQLARLTEPERDWLGEIAGGVKAAVLDPGIDTYQLIGLLAEGIAQVLINRLQQAERVEALRLVGAVMMERSATWGA